MGFLELAAKRYSVRAYRPDPIPEDLLQSVLGAARLAPTAASRQAFQLIVIETSERKEELARIYGRPFFTEAPLVICICTTPAQAWTRADGRNYADVDAAIAMDHLILAAADLGLGTCWVANFDANAARQVLGLPDGVEPIAFTPLGYAADSPVPKKRKSLSELVRRGYW